jgi:CheY-like chemotaxis protein
MTPEPVLVVDDDDDVRESLMDFLRDYGYEPVGASDGRDALEKLTTAAIQPCVIILDLMMPIMDGRAFREKQLGSPELARIPVVVISAYKDVAEVLVELGVDNHFPKPLNLNALLKTIKKLCPSS